MPRVVCAYMHICGDSCLFKNAILATQKWFESGQKGNCSHHRSWPRRLPGWSKRLCMLVDSCSESLLFPGNKVVRGRPYLGLVMLESKTRENLRTKSGRQLCARVHFEASTADIRTTTRHLLKDTYFDIIMALNPKFGGQILAAGVNPRTIHTLELYLDYGVSFQHTAQV